MAKKAKSAGIMDLVKQHVEKGVFALVVVALLLFIWSSFRKGLEPELAVAEIDKLSKEADEYITVTKTLPPSLTVKVEQYPDQAQKVFADGGLRDVLEPTAWNPLVVTEIQKRSQPMLFPIEELYAHTVIMNVSLNDQKALEEAEIAKLEKDKQEAARKAKEEERRQREEARRAAAAARTGGGIQAGGGPRNPGALFPPGTGGAKGSEKSGDKGVGGIIPGAVEEESVDHPSMVRGVTGVRSVSQHAAVVTGLMPYKKLYSEYRRNLTENKEVLADRQPILDEPLIVSYAVERAEVVNPAEPLDKLAWQDITKTSEQWFLDNRFHLEKQEEVVPQPFIADRTAIVGKARPMAAPVAGALPAPPASQSLTYFLPKLTDRLWRRDATHPRVPLVTDLPPDEQALEQAGDVFAGEESQNIIVNESTEEPVDAALVDDPSVEIPEYKLFRFMDVTIEPGKAYRYRVTLTFYNPNYGVDPKYLKEADKNKFPEIKGSPSEPSNLVTAKPASRIYAEEVRVSNRPTERSNAKIWHWAIDPSRGMALMKDYSGVEVGDLLENVATFKNNIVNYLVGGTQEITNFLFHTGDGFLVDIRGGDKHPTLGTTSSGEVIYQENGQLRTSHALRDKVRAEQWKKLHIIDESQQGSPYGSGVPGFSVPGLGRPGEIMRPGSR
ncbi:MAG: hypothetical protein SFX18_00665 [Pirellulales bacterium]|nr:hypothetical protein [Pirellulales bacterium]